MGANKESNILEIFRDFERFFTYFAHISEKLQIFLNYFVPFQPF